MKPPRIRDVEKLAEQMFGRRVKILERRVEKLEAELDRVLKVAIKVEEVDIEKVEFKNTPTGEEEDA